VTTDRRQARQFGVRRWLEDHDLDALLITHLPNIRYLTGFTGSAGLLVVRPTESVLITDFRYAVQAPREVGDAAAVLIEQSSVWQRLRRHIDGYQTLGFESAVLSVREAQRLGEGLSTRLVPTHDVVELLRAIKDPVEVAAIREAAGLALEALGAVLPSVTVGNGEREIAGRLESELRQRGSEWHPFPTIVASGPRSALPHAGKSDRTVQRGDLLLVDFGAQVDGYCSDLTRTFVVGAAADERQGAIYDLVRSAQVRAIDGISAGKTGREVDALARDLIAARGFGDAFGHSLGHGLGLEIHEAPRLGPREDGVLPVGAVVTVEPGVYLPGWGGVRIEDDVYLGSGAAERLSGEPSELMMLG
jgi:Xaa-Pro aminopeptidase